MSNKKLYLYPVWIRLWHVLNAVCFLLLILTGISLHYTSAEGNMLIRFDVSVTIHNLAAIIITFNYGIFIVGNVVSGNNKHYKGWHKNLIQNVWKQGVFYVVGIFKKEPHPFPITKDNKFNPLQKLFYVLVMYLGMPLLIISGLGLLFPQTIAYTVFGISGLMLTDLLHITMGFCLTLFLVIHIYTCTLGEKPNTLFKGMITGYHDAHEE